ncbi:MAG TPA: diguanylate cyclase [Terriglobales bacterium]|nr:diguanylate cyclase [Terriglobales bacterium]
MRPPALLLMLCLLPLCAAAQRFPFAGYGQSNGLGNLNINGIVEDGEGFLWVGTENGLFRLEGDQFRRFGHDQGLANEFVYSLHVDRAGQLWVGTDDGLYHKQGDRFVDVRETDGEAAGRRLAVKPDAAFADEKNGNLLVVTSIGLVEVSGGGAHRYGPAVPQPIRSVFAGRDGALWIGCGDALCRVADGQWSRWGEQRGVPRGVWMELFQAHDGTLWARDGAHVIALPEGGDRFHFEETGLPAERANDGYFTIAEDAAGRILTASAHGLARWQAGRWTVVGPAQGLPPYPITMLRLDRQNRFWMGLAGHGLTQWLGYGQWESWTPQEGLASSSVWSILPISPTLTYVASEQGVNIVNAATGAVQPWGRLGADGREAVRFMQQTSDGHAWFVNRSGVINELDPASQALHRYQAFPGVIRTAMADRENRLWVATSSGLYVNTAGRAGRVFQLVRDAAFDTNYFYDIAEAPNGEFWASGRTGLFHLTAGHWHKVDLGANHLDPRFELIVPLSGSVWVSDYSRAIDRLWIVGDKVTGVEAVNPPVVASEQVVFLHSDQRGWLWVGTDHGADVFNGKSWRRVTQDNGLLWNDLDERAFAAAPDGSVWIGSSAGVSHWRAPRDAFAPLDLRAVITSIEAPGRGRPLLASFTGLGAASSGELSYRYRLRGLENDWTETPHGEARYASLPPGHYQFEVEAVDGAQHLASAAAVEPVLIKAPWWRSGPFEITIPLLVFALALQLWGWRERYLRRRAEGLERLIAARTEELETEKAELLAAREELRIQATRDSLTQLWNRRAIFELLETELARAAREDCRVAVVLVDLDHFKAVNDRFGHLRGDRVLQEAGRRFVRAARPYDSIGRYGGEEFLIIMPGLDHDDGVARLEAFRRALTGEPFVIDGAALQLTCSLGVSWVRGAAVLEDVLDNADRALYLAKKLGRDRVEYANAWR